ncbi:uncharacterized protein DKFZp434B061-like [Amphibalanus amphitrite]|uniref:uncharacterized protein DKFZp434B061-like n=1 Tax=Amphibalanus amphitrite TaxID=1232801 RepID=UPI001C908D7F|nr:uncharacterized protein DKFZp434B061-like [Amphibalanus amphitrite]
MKARRSSGLRYRPYARSTSIHHSDPEVICDDDEPDDTIVVVYDRRRHQAAPAAPGRGAAAGRKDGGAGAAAAASSGTPASAAPGSAPPPAGGTATKSQLEFSPWRVSRIPLPADPNTPDHSKTLCASPADAATSGHKAAAELTVDELFSPFSASPVVRNTDTGTVKKWKRNRRKSRRGKGPITSTPAPGAPGGARGSTGSAPATPAALRPPDVSEVRDVTPFVITLDEDPTVLEVTEVRRVVRQTTPSEKRTVRTDLSADVMLLDTSSERTPARRLRAANLSKMRPGRVGSKSPGGRVTKKSPAQPARKSPAKKSPAVKGKTAAGTAAPAADLESSLEEGELSRTRHDSNDCTVVRVKPLRRTSSTQRRLQAVKKMAVRTLSRSQVKTPSRPGKSGRSHRSKRSDRPRDHRSQRNLKGPNERGPTRWMVDRRGSRFAAPLGATSDQPIKFAPDFSESFARMVSERPKRPVIIDGPNVAYA